MYDPFRSEPHAFRAKTVGSKQRWVGLVALLGLVATLVFPRAFWKREGGLGNVEAAPRVVTRERAEAERQRGVQEATEAIASLSSALGALSRVDSRMQAREPVPDPPPPEAFSSPTACVRSYLRDVDLADGSADSLCTETDLWTTERTFDVRLSHRAGGARHWTRLGRYSMAALATLRAGCCVAPEPLTAVVPGLWCGILRDQLRAFGAAPGSAVVADYTRMLRCLEARAVHLPERWARVSPDDSQNAFDEFLLIARKRRKDE